MSTNEHLRPFAGYRATHFRWGVDADAKVATVTLNRPERRNPLTFDSYAELRDLFRGIFVTQPRQGEPIELWEIRPEEFLKTGFVPGEQPAHESEVAHGPTYIRGGPAGDSFGGEQKNRGRTRPAPGNGSGRKAAAVEAGWLR